jgi:hypothetical protein
MPWRRLGDRRYSSYAFTTASLDGGEWSVSCPGRALPSWKGPPVPIVEEAGWAPELVWTHTLEEKSSAPAGYWTSIARLSSPYPGTILIEVPHLSNLMNRIPNSGPNLKVTSKTMPSENSLHNFRTPPPPVFSRGNWPKNAKITRVNMECHSLWMASKLKELLYVYEHACMTIYV